MDGAIRAIATRPASKMREIEEKVLSGERLTLEDGLFLYREADLLELGRLADEFNRRLNGLNVYFVQNMSLYFTNVCEERCAFCHFRRDEGEPGAYTVAPDEMIEYVRRHYHPDMREFHITGGHNPHMPFEYYVECVRTLKRHFPDVTIKAYTAAEIDFFAKISGLSYEDVLRTLMEAGVETLPGGGAEILSERYRRKMRVEKASVHEWLQVHRTAHRLGMKTHATMLYGLVETLEERLEHMILLRELQDETGGFLVFVPNAVQPAPGLRDIRRRVPATDSLRTIAVSRLMLDNFPHIKAYFINLGVELTKLALSFGASDVHGTIVQERISHSAGAKSPEGLTRDELVWLIRGAGRVPVERDTFYRVIRTY